VDFQHQADAERFLKEFEERLAKFELELHPHKTRLIEFGRFARQNQQGRGGTKRRVSRSGIYALLRDQSGQAIHATAADGKQTGSGETSATQTNAADANA